MAEKTDSFKGTIFADSSIFIYLLEKNPRCAAKLERFFNEWNLTDKKIISSVLTVSEVMVKPIKQQNEALIKRYEEIFKFMPSLKLVSPNYDTALLAAKIKAKYGFGLIDCYQLAMAKENGCQTFWCNDKQLRQYKEMKVLTLE